MEVKKMFYTMGEVSEMFDVSSSLIRHWEKHFDIIKPVRNKKGNRLFTPKDVENFKMIYHLVKERGMTLEGANKSLRRGKDSTSRDVELMDRLLNMRSLLLEVREVLKQEGEEPEDEPIVEPAPVAVEPAVISLDSVEMGDMDSVNPATRPRRREGESSEEKELFAFYEQNLF